MFVVLVVLVVLVGLVGFLGFLKTMRQLLESVAMWAPCAVWEPRAEQCPADG